MDYGHTFPAWRDNAAASWRSYTHHAFVEQLGDGTLPEDAFLRYQVQDYIFLIHFSRAWALAVTKAETVEEMRLAAATVNSLINDEIALHIRSCAAAGLSEADLFAATEHPANLAYTRYVLDAGHSGDFLDLMAALTPCAMGYGEIGLRLKAEATSDRYADWIETYSGTSYQQGCVEAGALIDSAVARRIGEAPTRAARWPQLCARFEMATQLEIGFWDMGLNG